jgi:hypothetical protein
MSKEKPSKQADLELINKFRTFTFTNPDLIIKTDNEIPRPTIRKN